MRVMDRAKVPPPIGGADARAFHPLSWDLSTGSADLLSNCATGFFLPESAHGLSILKTPVLHSGCDKIRPCYIGS